MTEAPTIDGILDEGVWRSATPMSEFIQAEPLEGEAASEQTEVRILYDDEAIFIGAILYDEDPSEIVTTDTRRDSGLGDQDSFQVIFDTFLDRQNGFVFGTNAGGVQWDGQVRSQGRASSSWDGSWEVQTNKTEAGWTAEFRIPLRTLRYGPPPQAWGVNFERNIPRTRERTYWAPLARAFELGRLSSAGELQRLELKAPRNFKILPYVTGSANRNFTPGSKTQRDGDFGLDAKFGVTGSLNLDVTYNTDFAQVEVDTQQINLTRFNLRFPEKRPFFLENSGLFQVGKDRDLEGLEKPFEVYPGIVVPPGVYANPRLSLRVNTDRRKWLFGRLQYDLGGFLSGEQKTFLHQMIIRQGGTFTWDATWTRTNITLPQGAFQTDLANTRITYNFTPSVFTQSLIQYNTRTQRWSTNLRFHWLETAGTGLFVVYNDTESMNGNGPVNRAFIIKYVRQFDLLN